MKKQDDIFSLSSLPMYHDAIMKLTVSPSELSEDEKVFLLACAIMLIRRYEEDRRCTSYIELAYFIILRYSLVFSDYEPLFDFCVNFGFYPIANAISQNNLINLDSISTALLPARIEEEYSRGSIVETLEQNQTHATILSSDANTLSFVAPTSFGKSSIVLDHIRNKWDQNKRVAIIVPTKSLLMQTYRAVKRAEIPAKVLLHDEMYDGEERFIAVFTQERALRLLDKHAIAFDILYIDEAHRLLDRDSRSVLLTRLIKLNKERNINAKIVYLSPLVANSNNLKISNQQEIFEQRIRFNIKEPRYFEYRTDHTIYQYSRFLNEFFLLGSAAGMFEYILGNCTSKSFCYLYAPRKIEQFARELAAHLKPVPVSDELRMIIRNLSAYVHEDFYAIDYLKHGVVYLHGKMPDNVKEYLEYKYARVPALQFVIANKVILEGINLPITSIFILNGHRLHEKELTNLIGRVNRLDQVFGTSTHLDRLEPVVHFVNSDEYNRQSGKLENKIRMLKSTAFEDQVRNPVLECYSDDEKVKPEDKQKCDRIKQEEDAFFTSPKTPQDELKKRMIALGMNTIFDLSDDLCAFILFKMNKLLNYPNLHQKHVLERLRYIFIRNNDSSILDAEFSRLKNDEAIAYYKMFLDDRSKSLKENIAAQVAYFRRRIENGIGVMYIGESYGEMPYPSPGKVGYQKDVYIDLSTKTTQQLVNIAIIKLKMEEDFVSFKLHMFFQLMLDYGIITVDEYNQIIYGTTNSYKLRLIKMGLTMNIINRLDQDNQLGNITVDDHGNIMTNDAFEHYREQLDDFHQFELNKFM